MGDEHFVLVATQVSKDSFEWPIRQTVHPPFLSKTTEIPSIFQPNIQTKAQSDVLGQAGSMYKLSRKHDNPKCLLT